MRRLALVAPLLFVTAGFDCGDLPGSSSAVPAPSDVYQLPNGMRILNDHHPYQVALTPRPAAPTAPAETPAPQATVPKAVVPGSCLDGDAPTTFAGACCSGQSEWGFCVPLHKSCAQASDCAADQTCHGETCCRPSGGCFTNADCCSGKCSGDICAPLAAN